jgi:DsrE/DsrF/DsrH-like protein
MSPSVIVVIHGDPLKTHRPVEALRIALGLSTGDNPLTVVLLDRSPLLLTDETGELMDAEILEKYLPSLKQLKVPFVVPVGAHAAFTFDSGFDVRPASAREIEELVSSADRILAF